MRQVRQDRLCRRWRYGAREWFTVRRYSAGKATRIADDVTPDIYELCSKCNTSFMTFMQKDDESFEAWLKEAEQ